jgi:DNA-binding NarL/FixJ family response regulator
MGITMIFISEMDKQIAMRKVSVMIIDDHTLFRETLTNLINADERCEVIANVGDGAQAIELVRDRRPDLVLLDINMSPINGYEILKQIRKFSPVTKVVGLSMYSQPVFAKKMLRGGAKGYLTKNSDTDELLKAIEEVMEGKTYLCQEVKNILVSQAINDEGEVVDSIHSLSERELEIIDHIRDGLSSKEIADKLGVNSKTIEVHRHNILKKLNVKNSAALIQLINEHGL